jgi:uncharacterized membrane protein
MEALFILGGLFFLLGVPALAIFASVRARGLSAEVSALRRKLAETDSRIDALQRKLAAPPATDAPASYAPIPDAPIPDAPLPDALTSTVAVATAEPAAPPPVPIPVPAPDPELDPGPVPGPAPKPARKGDFELKLGGSVFIWIGAVMLALAGAFLVKYSIDVGLLSPAVRIALGLLLGLVLLGAGQYVRRQSPSIAQALAAAAVADWFASLFAAVALYHLIDPLFGFIALAVVTAVGILLALREGMPVGVIGIAGGFITPAIVATGTPQPIGLFVYLYLIQLGALILQHKRGWWQLAALGIGGGLLWALLLAAAGPAVSGLLGAAALSLPLFLLATDVTQLWSLHGKGGVAVSREMILTARTASIACFLLMALWLRLDDHALSDWGCLIAMTLLHLAAARRFASEEIPALVGAAIAIAAFAAWGLEIGGGGWALAAPVDRSAEVILIGLVLGAVFGAGGFWFAFGARHPARWAGLSTLGTAFLFGGAYLHLDEADLLLSWPIQAVMLAGLHMAAAERLNRLRQREPKYTGALGLHCLAVSGFLALAVPMRLEQEWIAVSWAIELPMMAWVALRLDLPWLRRGIWVGGALILGAVLLSGFPTGDWLIFNRLLYGIGIPCAALVATAQILKRMPADAEGRLLVMALELVGAGLLALLIGLEIGHFMGRVAPDSGSDLLRAGAAASSWLGLAAGLFTYYRRQVAPDRVLLYAGFGFAALGSFALIAGCFVLRNPLFASIDVGHTWVFNRLLVAYALPAVMLLLTAERMPSLPGPAGALPARGLALLGLLAGFAYFTLAVRQAVHGADLSIGPVTDAEQYGYSAAWTLYGIGLLLLGTWKRSQMLRYASAVVVLLTVLKVFLVDASDLTGLYRVASFLGLGLTLIGIGYLYQRLLFKPRE